MATIEIKHIGPLANTGILKLTPVLLFIGKQSTGKSTLMKIICFCRWIEKQVMVGDENFIYRLKAQPYFLRGNLGAFSTVYENGVPLVAHHK